MQTKKIIQYCVYSNSNDHLKLHSSYSLYILSTLKNKQAATNYDISTDSELLKIIVKYHQKTICG